MIRQVLHWLRADPYARGSTDWRRPPDCGSLVPDPPNRMQHVFKRVRVVKPILDERPIDVYYLAYQLGVAKIPKKMAKPYVATSPLVEVR